MTVSGQWLRGFWHIDRNIQVKYKNEQNFNIFKSVGVTALGYTVGVASQILKLKKAKYFVKLWS